LTQHGTEAAVLSSNLRTERDSDTINVRTFKYGRRESYWFEQAQINRKYSIYLATK